MLKLSSVTFKDEENGKNIEIDFKDNHFTSNAPISVDEYLFCLFHAGLILTGGIESTKNFIKQNWMY